jgi:cytoskeletal protein CcmA (bactofilin family)
MANDVAVLGRSTHVRGRITGSGSIEISGRVDGDVDLTGDVVIETSGLIGANVSGRRVVVRGAVKGDLIGAESITLEDGAKVVGDVRAPRIAISQGALLRGFVQTAGGGSAPRAKTQTTSAARPAISAARISTPHLAPQLVQKSAQVEKPAAKSAPAKIAAKPAAKVQKAPPPPVVPALKKGVKATRRIGVLAGGKR